MGGRNSRSIEASAQLFLLSIVSNITSVDRTIAPQFELYTRYVLRFNPMAFGAFSIFEDADPTSQWDAYRIASATRAQQTRIAHQSWDWRIFQESYQPQKVNQSLVDLSDNTIPSNYPFITYVEHIPCTDCARVPKKCYVNDRLDKCASWVHDRKECDLPFSAARWQQVKESRDRARKLCGTLCVRQRENSMQLKHMKRVCWKENRIA